MNYFMYFSDIYAFMAIVCIYSVSLERIFKVYLKYSSAGSFLKPLIIRYIRSSPNLLRS